MQNSLWVSFELANSFQYFTTNNLQHPGPGKKQTPKTDAPIFLIRVSPRSIFKYDLQGLAKSPSLRSGRASIGANNEKFDNVLQDVQLLAP